MLKLKLRTGTDALDAELKRWSGRNEMVFVKVVTPE